VGSVIGGLIARLFSKPPAGSKFHPAGFLLSIIDVMVIENVTLNRATGGRLVRLFLS
jgi:hypothetical protein